MKILYRYLDAAGELIEEHVGEPGNWSIIPERAAIVQVTERKEGA